MPPRLLLSDASVSGCRYLFRIISFLTELFLFIYAGFGMWSSSLWRHSIYSKVGGGSQQCEGGSEADEDAGTCLVFWAGTELACSTALPALYPQGLDARHCCHLKPQMPVPGSLPTHSLIPAASPPGRG